MNDQTTQLIAKLIYLLNHDSIPKERLYHVTPAHNLPSITKHGILPNYNPTHHKLLRKHGLGKVVYLFSPTDTRGRFALKKYAQDTIYWHIWGKPKNLLLHKFYKRTKNWPKNKPVPMPNVISAERNFVILAVIPFTGNFYWICRLRHEQSRRMTCFNHMDHRYSHNGLKLTTYPNTIPPSQIRVVGQVKVTVKDNINMETTLYKQERLLY